MLRHLDVGQRPVVERHEFRALRPRLANSLTERIRTAPRRVGNVPIHVVVIVAAGLPTENEQVRATCRQGCLGHLRQVGIRVEHRPVLMLHEEEMPADRFGKAGRAVGLADPGLQPVTMGRCRRMPIAAVHEDADRRGCPGLTRLHPARMGGGDVQRAANGSPILFHHGMHVKIHDGVVFMPSFNGEAAVSARVVEPGAGQMCRVAERAFLAQLVPGVVIAAQLVTERVDPPVEHGGHDQRSLGQAGEPTHPGEDRLLDRARSVVDQLERGIDGRAIQRDAYGGVQAVVQGVPNRRGVTLRRDLSLGGVHVRRNPITLRHDDAKEQAPIRGGDVLSLAPLIPDGNESAGGGIELHPQIVILDGGRGRNVGGRRHPCA